MIGSTRTAKMKPFSSKVAEKEKQYQRLQNQEAG